MDDSDDDYAATARRDWERDVYRRLDESDYGQLAQEAATSAGRDHLLDGIPVPLDWP